MAAVIAVYAQRIFQPIVCGEACSEREAKGPFRTAALLLRSAPIRSSTLATAPDQKSQELRLLH
jgi:hypothetical protein